METEPILSGAVEMEVAEPTLGSTAGPAEGEAAYEPAYNDMFPALPEATVVAAVANPMGQWNNRMRIGSSVVTQVFRVPVEERKLDNSDRFGEGESLRTCHGITKETGASIEISSSRDQSLTFLVTGKQSAVLDARRRILQLFQTQASSWVVIPKEHHRFILGKAGTKLRDLEKVTGTKIQVPNMADSSETIVVTGSKEGIEKALHEMQVTSDEQSKQAYERVSVPKMYHPFVCGAHNERLNALAAETGARINVPPLSVMKDEITIAGEKEGVLAAKQRIIDIHTEMEKKCSIVSVEVPRSQHKYVIGHRGATIAEILQATGVSVEMPAADSSVGTVTLRGPHDKLGLALSMVCEKANSVQTATVAAPNWIHKYIIGRKGANIRLVTQDLPKVHVEFTDKEDRIKIEGPPEEVEKARAALEVMANDLVKKLTFVELRVEPRFYKHIIGKAGANVNRLKDELGVVINITEGEVNSIRIEGSREGVDKAASQLQEMVKKMEDEKEQDVVIEHRFYRTLIGAKGERIREIREQFNKVQITFPGPGEKRDAVKVRGPQKDVERCAKHLLTLVKELAETSFVADVPVFKQFHKFVIGKAGANIRKIRDETRTKIDLPAEGETSDVITITGRREDVEVARDRIIKIQEELANVVTKEISIPAKFYNSLIGAGGKLIHAVMEDCGGVAIKFPPPDSKSDKVTVRGPADDVERAVTQLLELTSEKQLHSFTAEVRAKPQHHKFLIGKAGANIRKLRDSTGARIVFPGDKDEDKEAITVIGTKEAVAAAKAQLEQSIKDIDNVVEGDMTVEPRHHRHFVARRGELLHKISDECGGVLISFPRPGVDSDRVVLKGAAECIAAAKQRILDTVAELEANVTKECIIEQRHHRTVMGARGSKVQRVTADHDVQVKFPDRGLTGEDGDVIRVTGKEPNVDAAVAALLALVPVTEAVDVPFDYHRALIGQKGKDVKLLMEKFDVHIVLSPVEQHNDIVHVSGTPANVALATEAIQQRCVELDAERGDRALRGFELRLEVDPEFHPKIIGRKGAVVSKIREEHGVQVSFPRKGDPDESVIVVTGYEANATAARDAILAIVRQEQELTKVEVKIDARVHSRLIGARGRNVRKIMDQFAVDVKFPRATDADPEIVTLAGAEQAVLDAKEHLLNLEEEYLQDVNEADYRDSHRPPPTAALSTALVRNDSNSNGDVGGGGQFVVKGGPWEQAAPVAPDTASQTEFPRFGPGKPDPSAEVSAPRALGPWGPRR